MHHQIDSLAHTNKLRLLPAQQKIIFAISLLILGYVAPASIQITITLWLAWWIIIYAQIPVLIYLKLIALPVSFWLISLPAFIFGITWLNHNLEINPDILVDIKLGKIYIYLSHQGIKQAQTTIIRTLALTSCLYFILLTVPFSQIIQVLRNYGCPLLLTELLLLMYRFIFVLTQTAKELITAQKSRFGYLNWQTSLNSLSLIIGQILQRSLFNYREMSLGLTSRGFNGEFKVLHFYHQKTNWRYLIEAIIGYTFLLILIIQDYVN